MKLIFEKSASGRGSAYLPPCDVECSALPESLCRDIRKAPSFFG